MDAGVYAQPDQQLGRYPISRQLSIPSVCPDNYIGGAGVGATGINCTVHYHSIAVLEEGRLQ